VEQWLALVTPGTTGFLRRQDNARIAQLRLVKVKLSLSLTNYALCHEGVWGSGCIDQHFLDLGTSWRCPTSLLTKN
jgi:hypothetical protein